MSCDTNVLAHFDLREIYTWLLKVQESYSHIMFFQDNSHESLMFPEIQSNRKWEEIQEVQSYFGFVCFILLLFGLVDYISLYEIIQILMTGLFHVGSRGSMC